MLKGAERGCLVMADISGYTGLLVDTELEHAQDALRDLIQTVVGKLRPQFRLAKLEGDAAFVYSITDAIDGSQLLDTLEAAYFSFRRRLESISRATTCDCNACIRIPSLNLKVIAHHGAFVRQRLYGVEELTGSDVIVAHRLLKNRVAEQLGSGGYLLLTDACLAAARLEPAPLGLRVYRDEFEGIGEVVGWVHDLEAAWRRERELRRVRVSEKETALLIEADIPGPQQVVWEWATDPVRRPQFVPGVLRVDEASAGRRGVGTTNHCMHGEGVTLEEILDWRPFDYFTLQTTLPNGLSATIMEELVETEAGTHVVIRVGKQKSARGRETFAQMRDMIDGLYQASLAQLGRLVEAESRGSGDEPAAATGP